MCSEHNSALTNQGLQLLGTEGEYWADHKDRNCHFVTQESGYEDYNPNFFKTFNSWDPSEATDVVGYGYLSIVQGIDDVLHICRETTGLTAPEALRKRRELLERWEAKRALPAQALLGTAVNEAVRLSLANHNKYVGFDACMFPHVL